MPTKFKSKFIQQYYKLQTLPKFMNHQHCPNFTMTKSSTIQKCPKAKITTWSQEFPNQPYNMQNFNKSKHQPNDNVSTSNSQKTWNQQNSQQRSPKNELTLKSILKNGGWVLGSWRNPSSSFHSRDGWYFFPLKVRKDGPLEDAIVNARKSEGLGMGFKNGFMAKLVKNTKI